MPPADTFAELVDLRHWLQRTQRGPTGDDRLRTLARELEGVVASGITGDVVEIGCCRGVTALWMRTVLDELGDDRMIHVYDSFQGLPEPGTIDSDYLSAGDLAATVDDVLTLHATWKKQPPTIHPGWFTDTLPTELPDQIAFAYLDADFYQSTLDGLTHCVPRLVRHGVLIIDDYADVTANPRAWNGLPGVMKACDDYFGDPSPVEVLRGVGDLAYGRYKRG